MRKKIMKDILLYLIMPEDSTEARVEMTVNPALVMKHSWLGPLKTIIWTVVAVAVPLLLLAFRV